ncbi:FAD-binding oxidoreductase [Streptomyces radicis]|uniref:D-amino-acid oxidase n=1 Tax=Streptomyces radicis TaxID=1750517 RepID=A0A3A9WWA9_9ACTN|nr:FAD-binding oxidoreductase [Streptomyces radicis]RKN25851.1 FAD-binding oxidoreductase [Streptomyces radicis]
MVGAGVIGLTTAIVVAEAGYAVRVLTREPPAATTSALAGALWEPFLAEPRERLARWAYEGLPVLAQLAEREGETGVRLVDGVEAHRSADAPPPWWSAEVPGLVSPAAPADLPPGYRSGHRARLPLLDMPRYLGYLTDRLAAAGGRIERRTVGSLAQLGDQAGALVNCTGLGARDLVPDDALRPVRGHVLRVANPGIERWFVDVSGEDGEGGEEIVYVLPQRDTVILGGTAHRDRWDTTPDPRVAERILRRCAAAHPALATARVLTHRVGLRPWRPRVRLERETLPNGVVCVHSYGHGGCGVTVSWGCAAEALALLTGRSGP